MKGMRAMAFPPNYRQERSNRDKAKQRKADEKLAKREEKLRERKVEPDDAAQTQPVENKDV
jgi:hypothetical protein